MNTTQKIIHTLLMGGFHRAILLPDIESGEPDSFAYIGAVRDDGFYEIVRVTSLMDRLPTSTSDLRTYYGVDLGATIWGNFAVTANSWCPMFDAEEELPAGGCMDMDDCDDDQCFYHIDDDYIVIEVAGLIIHTDQGAYETGANVEIYRAS